ncbi:MAG: hypothetical protein ACRC2R_20200 [Xenococcaceae cyanobacterium]
MSNKYACAIALRAGFAIATIVLTFAPVAAFAQQTQVNSQSSKNNAAAVGRNNTVIQNTQQDSIQNGIDVNQYLHGNGGDPQTQINRQDSENSAAAVGDSNLLIQKTMQESMQQQGQVGR